MTTAVKISFATLLVIILHFTSPALADSSPDLTQMDQEIHLAPWQSYQKIIGLQLQTESFSELEYLWWLLRKAQVENLIYFYEDFNISIVKAQQLITKNTPLELQARINILLGISLQRKGNYQRSERLLTKALSQAKSAGLKRLYIYGKQELAYTKTLTELFETSLSDIQEAYVEAFALKDQLLIATINETYGAIYGYLNDYEKSIEYYQRAFESYKSLKYPAHIAEAVYGLASTYRYWKKYDLAIEYFELYKDKISYTPNSNISFFSAYGIGMTLAEQGRCELAITKIDEALKLKGLIDYNAELYKRKASCLITLKDLSGAEQSLLLATKAFADVPELMGTRWQLEVIKISGQLAFERGDFELAYQLTSQYYQAFTTLLEKNSSQRLLRVRAALEIERQQIALALEEKRSQVELLELERQERDAANQVFFNVCVIFLIIIILVVIIIQYRTNAKMRLLTIEDELSGLFNRRYIFEYLDKYIVSTNKKNSELAIMLIDVDDFKAINDKHGHPIGDNVIKKIAEIGKQCLRSEDIMGRIGGEEFICILENTDLAEVVRIGQRLLEKINEQYFIAGSYQRVTVSMGIAQLSQQCQDIDQLYVNADEALYRSKHNGKNQINVHSYDS